MDGLLLVLNAVKLGFACSDLGQLLGDASAEIEFPQLLHRDRLARLHRELGCSLLHREAHLPSHRLFGDSNVHLLLAEAVELHQPA